MTLNDQLIKKSKLFILKNRKINYHLKIRDQNHKFNIIRNQNYNLTFIKLIDITQVCNMAICNDKISHSSTPYGIWKHLKQIVRKHGDNY